MIQGLCFLIILILLLSILLWWWEDDTNTDCGDGINFNKELGKCICPLWKSNIEGQIGCFDICEENYIYNTQTEKCSKCPDSHKSKDNECICADDHVLIDGDCYKSCK